MRDVCTVCILVFYFISSLAVAEDASAPASTTLRGFQPLGKPVRGLVLDDRPITLPHARPRRLGIGPDPNRPDYFLCNTTTCSRHEKYYEITDKRTTFTHENHQCPGALDVSLKGFGTSAPATCKEFSRGRVKWNGCRAAYCDMYQKLVMAVTNGTEYYFGSTCHDILSFNQTICNAYYRDAWGFCECVCPALLLLDSTEPCERSIIAYLLFGKMNHPLLQKFPMSPLCSTYFCKWVEKIADPRNRVKDAPAGCLNVQLPFQRSQCEQIMRRARTEPVYDPCPWDTPSSGDFIMNCTDGTSCDVRVDTWACCQRHGKRGQCPKNFPVMCNDPLECVGQSEHCCVEEAALCKSGPRICSPLMAPLNKMPEWKGMIPVGGPAYVAPTTTMSQKEFEAWLSRQPRPTTEPESWGEDVMPYLPFIITPIIMITICATIGLCYKFGFDTWKVFSNSVFGARRFLTVYRTDVVHKFAPTDANVEYEDLPPRISNEEKARVAANEAAQAGLENACLKAFAFGRIHLVSAHFATGPGPQAEALAIQKAVADIRARGMADDRDNPRLIEEGLKWTATLHAETAIVEAMEVAWPYRTVDYKNLAPAPVPGAPWAGTTVGQAVNNDKRRQVWAAVEELSQSAKTAESSGASPGLVLQANELLQELIARTPELPADRCVLDPGGQGVKILPKGSVRNVWPHTGDSYLYNPETQKAGELNNFELPSSDKLRDAKVDPCRPVCASYAKTLSCKAGRRCPWRHCKPVEGDTIRECIFF